MQELSLLGACLESMDWTMLLLLAKHTDDSMAPKLMDSLHFRPKGIKRRYVTHSNRRNFVPGILHRIPFLSAVGSVATVCGGVRI